jgi:pimeloyl-ACP methyl ester carboxylesterase
MGTKDLPAVIDYILQTTGADQIFYAGHSMGTTMFYVLCAQRPEYNSKIRAMFSLAPVAFMTNVTCPLMHLVSKIAVKSGVRCQLIYDYVIQFSRMTPTNTLSMYTTNKILHRCCMLLASRHSQSALH